MKTAALKEVDISLRDEWLHTVEDLKQLIAAWVAEEPGWSTANGEEHRLQEDPIGVYSVTSMDIHTPEGRLVLEPIARNYPARGIVELYAWPTLFRVRLLRDAAKSGWRVRTDSGIFLREEWTRENFIALVNDLLVADA
jgi:hypothetical protein